MMKWLILSWAVLVSFCAAVARADVKMAALFSDHMVLQQDAPIPVWGTADPNESISISIADQRVTTTAGADGRWKLRLEKLHSETPLTMTIQGKNNATISNILIGEVWLASGQSNMAFAVSRKTNYYSGVNDEAREIAAADHPQIRFFTVEQTLAKDPATDVKGSWQVCSPETVSAFSAVAYFFARDLHEARHTPIGMIVSAYPGSTIQAWLSKDALGSDSAFATLFSLPPADPRLEQQKPTVLWNGQLAPLAPYAIRGVIWYQGESVTDTDLYLPLLRTLIQSWRENWANEKMPFVYVQLHLVHAPSTQPMTTSSFAQTSDAQRRATTIPATAMISALDLGEVDSAHPRNKQGVGKRLSIAARAVAYNEPLEYSGPLYESSSVEGNKVRIRFSHISGGLILKGDKLTGFAIAGADRKFVFADAEIDGLTVIVSSGAIPNPASVRFGYADNPPINLDNRSDLPASPFRTDDW